MFHLATVLSVSVIAAVTVGVLARRLTGLVDAWRKQRELKR